MATATASRPDAIADRRLELLANRAPRQLLHVFRGTGAWEFASRWPELAAEVAGVFLAAQVESLAVAEDCLSGLAGSPVAPDPTPYVGRVGNRSLSDYLDITPSAWQARVAQGATPQQATVAQVQHLAGGVTTEVHAVARDATIDIAATDPRFTGWARVAEPGACDFCRMLATRGAVYGSAETAAGKRYHRLCRCVARARPAGAGATSWDGTGERADFNRAVEAINSGARTPGRRAFVERQIDILSRLDNEWARGQLAALRAEMATF